MPRKPLTQEQIDAIKHFRTLRHSIQSVAEQTSLSKRIVCLAIKAEYDIETYRKLAFEHNLKYRVRKKPKDTTYKKLLSLAKKDGCRTFSDYMEKHNLSPYDVKRLKEKLEKQTQ